MNRIIAVLSLLALTGCVATGAKTIHGKNLGKPTWEIIDFDQSRLEGSNTSRSRLKHIKRNTTLPDRYQEQIVFKKGAQLFFEMKNRGGFAFPPTKSTIETVYVGKNLKGTPVKKSEFQDLVQMSDVVYSEVKRDDIHCMAYFKMLGRQINTVDISGSDAYLRGFVCTEGDFETFKKQVLGSLAALKVKD
ncbi:MAG: hypothetical protein OQJ97_14650 [Rhodospirillales bacterium]|nr:hypothetical protein [Rhodospirillales bacterium]